MWATIICVINRQRCIPLFIAVGLYYIACYTTLRSHIHLYTQHVLHQSAITSQETLYVQKYSKQCHGLINVQSAGNFTDRVIAFNAFLSSFRDEELKRLGSGAWQKPTSRRLNVVSGMRDDYLQILSNYSKITTIVLPWLKNISNSTLRHAFNMLIHTFYDWTADDKLCSWIETFGMTRVADFNRTCNRMINDTVRPSSVQISTGNTKYAFYIHIHRDAIVTQQGNVITDGLKLVLYGCRYNIEQSLASHLEKVPLYNEVFVVSQGIWGNGVFHRMIEVVPRIALLVNFLKSNPDVRIVAPHAGGRLAELLNIIGLDKTRLVTGVTRAKIVYQPRATPCGHANIQEIQMLSRLFRDYIKRNFPMQPRNKLILIRRSRHRKFAQQQSIQTYMQRVSREFNLNYTLYIDNPAPSLNETMMMFHSAVVIVAPVGAGESNMLFSQPGTYIVEGNCSPPNVNLCFMRLAYVLGHHWHGIMPEGGCPRVVNVSHSDIYDAVREYLRYWSSHSTTY